MVPTGEVPCTDVDMAAAKFRTFVHYAALNVGTMNDSVPTYGDMAVALGMLAAGAPKVRTGCGRRDRGADRRSTGRHGIPAGRGSRAAIAAQKEALTAVKDEGVAAWTAMGMNPADWDLTLQFSAGRAGDNGRARDRLADSAGAVAQLVRAPDS